jgi:catechol 2,3-dioxygenase-like lactoylglutathione lyase family enzyme
MLDFIVAVTLTAPDLEIIESAYGRWLDYRVVERGTVSPALAAHWAAPAVAGRDFIMMQPASGEPVYLRFVAQPATPGYAAMKTWGWNSTEILVEDPDALAQKLRDSPFRIIGEPRPLSMNPDIKAMQAIGPAGELLYLTRIPSGKSAFHLGSAKSFVDRVFIVVLGGPDMAAMRGFYGSAFGMSVTEASPARVGVLNNAWGFDAAHEIGLAIAQLPANFLIELDEYPRESVARPQRPQELPPAMAIVTFAVSSLDERPLDYATAPVTLPGLPYQDRRVALVRGAAGELIELIETGTQVEPAAEVEERED